MGDPQQPKIGGELFLELIHKLVQKFPSQPKMCFSAEIREVFYLLDEPDLDSGPFFLRFRTGKIP